MNTLQAALHTYVTMRRGLGYRLRDLEKRLADFIRFMEERGATIITSKLAVEWATSLPDKHATWTLRLSDVRGFAPYPARTPSPPHSRRSGQ